MSDIEIAARGKGGSWRPAGAVVAALIKRLVVAAAFRGGLSRSAASRIVGSRWLRGA